MKKIIIFILACLFLLSITLLSHNNRIMNFSNQKEYAAIPPVKLPPVPRPDK